MREFKITGIIIGKRRQGEKDYFVDIFSAQKGKITAIAKGALDIKSSFIGKLELGQKGNFIIHLTTKKYLIIKSCEIQKENIIEVKSLENFIYLSRILELLNKIEFGGELNEKIFCLLENALKAEIGEEYFGILLKIIILKLMGCIPECGQCSKCQKSLAFKEAYYSFEGELKCADCAEEQENFSEKLTFQQIKIINFTAKFLSQQNSIPKIKISRSDLDKINNYLNSILKNSLNVNLKAL